MKGLRHLIPILSLTATVAMYGQTAQIQALERAETTIAETEARRVPPQQEVLNAIPPAEEATSQPVFEIPQADVFLEIPEEATTTTVAKEEAETISVDFPDEDVRTIIRSVAELYELNVVIPETLTGSVSIKLRNVTWQQVFDVVLEPLRFTYIVDGNIIKIKSIDELLVEPVDTRVFIIDFDRAAEIRGSIEPLVDAANGGRIQVDTRSNALVITERPSRMNDIQEIIETLDRPTEQVMIESKFVEITNRDGENKGVDWASLSGYGLQAGPFQRNIQRENSRNVGQGSGNPSSGTSTSDTFTIDNNNGQANTSLSSITQSVTNSWWVDSNGRTDTAVFSADAFSMVISALETQADVEVVSNPTVVTMNNQEATINIGEEYPKPEFTYNEERGTFEVSGFDEDPYKIGVNLKVTPQINSAGFINMSIEPDISSRVGETTFGAATLPIIAKRTAKSTVTIKSGYTLAIGGLIEERGEQNESRVPVLGSMPVFGKLFSSTGRTTDKRNLVIFITAKILSASGATYEDVYSPRELHRMGVKPSDVPGYEPPVAELEMYDQVLKARDEAEGLRTELQLLKEQDAIKADRKKTEDALEEQKNPTPRSSRPFGNFRP